MTDNVKGADYEVFLTDEKWKENESILTGPYWTKQ